MIAPPLTAERLLEGLSAKTDFRGGILGDLAEEYAERVASDGDEAARRWYHREALRAAPHLLLEWARSLRLRDARRLLNVIVASYFLVTLLAALVMMLVQGTLQSLGMPSGFLSLVPRAAIPAVGLVLSAVTALLAGYFAASLDKETPLASAIVLGLLWVTPALVASIIAGSDESLWYRLTATVLIVGATTTGGMLHIRQTRFENRQGYLDWRGKFEAS